MGVYIAGQQRGLKKHQAGGPDRGGAAKPGQNDASDQRLNQEQQECAQEDRDREHRLACARQIG